MAGFSPDIGRLGFKILEIERLETEMLAVEMLGIEMLHRLSALPQSQQRRGGRDGRWATPRHRGQSQIYD
jgi:hypothetical protein